MDRAGAPEVDDDRERAVSCAAYRVIVGAWVAGVVKETVSVSRLR
jgi:hypothetical protein